MNINLQIIKVSQAHGTVLCKSLDSLKPQYNCQVQTLISKSLNFCKGIDLCIIFNKATSFQIAISMQQISYITCILCMLKFEINSYLSLQVMKIRTKIPSLHHPQMVLPSRSSHATFGFQSTRKKRNYQYFLKTNIKSAENESSSTYEHFLGKNVCTKFTLTISSNRKYFFTPGVSKLFFCQKKENNKGRITTRLPLK